jgi:hypothetical protein
MQNPPTGITWEILKSELVMKAVVSLANTTNVFKPNQSNDTALTLVLF